VGSETKGRKTCTETGLGGNSKPIGIKDKGKWSVWCIGKKMKTWQEGDGAEE
jgi:hypothetical protein